MASKILNPRLFLGLLILSLASGLGCKKKDRLTSSTATLSVTPAATALLKGETVTLTSQRRAPNGSVEVLPADWVVSGCGSASNLNVDFGESVVFTAPNTLCDATVTATFGGETATSRIAVVTYKPATTNYNVYSDQGIPARRIDMSPTPTSITITEPSTGYAPEGNKYLHFVSSVPNSVWFIQPPTVTDLSGYASGRIKFSIFLESAGEDWHIKVKDTSDYAVLLAGSHGFDNTITGEWQEISIPVSEFVTAGLDISAVTIPFILTKSGTSVYNIDAVRWEP